MARDLHPHLASLVAERHALLEKYDAEAAQLVEKNRQFLAEGDMHLICNWKRGSIFRG